MPAVLQFVSELVLLYSSVLGSERGHDCFERQRMQVSFRPMCGASPRSRLTESVQPSAVVKIVDVEHGDMGYLVNGACLA